MFASFAPTTITLWLSCPTLEASAPRRTEAPDEAPADVAVDAVAREHRRPCGRPAPDRPAAPRRGRPRYRQGVGHDAAGPDADDRPGRPARGNGEERRSNRIELTDRPIAGTGCRRAKKASSTTRPRGSRSRRCTSRGRRRARRRRAIPARGARGRSSRNPARPTRSQPDRRRRRARRPRSRYGRSGRCAPPRRCRGGCGRRCRTRRRATSCR